MVLLILFKFYVCHNCELIELAEISIFANAAFEEFHAII